MVKDNRCEITMAEYIAEVVRMETVWMQEQHEMRHQRHVRNARPWKKMSGKSMGMMENGVTRTAEEMQEDDDNGGGRDALLWVWHTSKLEGDSGRYLRKRRQQKWRDGESETAEAETWDGDKIDVEKMEMEVLDKYDGINYFDEDKHV